MVDRARSTFKNIGRFRLEAPKTADMLPSKMLGPRLELMAHVSGDTTDSFVKPAPAFEDLAMEDERNDDEASRLYPALVDVGGMPAAFVPHDEDTPYTDDEVDAAIRALWMPDAAARQTPASADTSYRTNRQRNLLVVAKYPGAGKRASVSARPSRSLAQVDTGR